MALCTTSALGTNTTGIFMSSSFSWMLVFSPKTVVASYQNLFGQGSSAGYFLHGMKLVYYDGSDHTLTSTIPTGSVNTLIISSNNNIATMQFNGSSSVFTASSVSVKNYAYLGTDSSNEAFTGYMMELCVWPSVAITPSNVKDLQTYVYRNYPLNI